MTFYKPEPPDYSMVVWLTIIAALMLYMFALRFPATPVIESDRPIFVEQTEL